MNRTTLVTALAVLILDIATKGFVMMAMTEGEVVSIIDGWVQLHYLKNPGAAYGLFSQHTGLLILLGILVGIGLWYSSRCVTDKLASITVGIGVGVSSVILSTG